MKFLQLQARVYPFFVTHASIITWDIFFSIFTTPRVLQVKVLYNTTPSSIQVALYNFKKIISKITQRSATPYNMLIILLFLSNIYGQGFGILFRSVKFSVPLTLVIYILLYIIMYKPVLCYEVFKKWLLLSLFPGCI